MCVSINLQFFAAVIQLLLIFGAFILFSVCSNMLSSWWVWPRSATTSLYYSSIWLTSRTNRTSEGMCWSSYKSNWELAVLLCSRGICSIVLTSSVLLAGWRCFSYHPAASSVCNMRQQGYRQQCQQFTGQLPRMCILCELKENYCHPLS
jgi:hypothetical protein